ncbi:MAG TPA: hypothetical protein VEB66_08970 [Opitutaceae bacterium]|nr:hypothetical protein [Opitutaceae bacterium]
MAWFPLDDPGDDVLYLQLTCASDAAGHVQVFYSTTAGINERESIHWPISATTQAFTYTFPLPDAPITELRLDPPGGGATLTIRDMRVIDRRGVEHRRFTRTMFVPVQQVAAVAAAEDGWRITSAPGSNDPFLRVELPAPILAKGRDHRNLLRCLLSAGYLAGMLWLLLLAVFSAFTWPKSGREFAASVAYLALLAALFALVGNRGLIRNSLRYARYVPPPVPPGLRLEFDLRTTAPSTAQLFWDTGRGFNEADSARLAYPPEPGLHTLRFDLPAMPPRGLRFDPLDGQGEVRIRGIRVVDHGHRTRAVLPADALEPGMQTELVATGESLAIRVAPGSGDPTTLFKPAAVDAIAGAFAPDAR